MMDLLLMQNFTPNYHMAERTYPLQFFAADKDNKIKHLPLVLSASGAIELRLPAEADPGLSSWGPLIQRICRAVGDEQHRLGAAIQPFADEQQPSSTTIQVLLLKLAHLRNPEFFYELCCAGPLRRIDPLRGSGQLAKHGNQAPFHPVITIGTRDIMSVYEEALGLGIDTEKDIKHWRELREERRLLYQLGLDHRVKFLDSSIWHRYLALDEPGSPRCPSTFDERLLGLLNKIVSYDQQGLYESVASETSLELSCRLLLNSFIREAGDQGHHEAVTPFKFHSETAMETKSERLLRFLDKTYENGTRLSDLSWNLLMVDDHSDQPLSSINGGKGWSNKKAIIDQLLCPDSAEHKRLKIEISGFTKGDQNIISSAIKQMRGQNFDIILLDYLLGGSETDPKLRAYGHEFLLEIATGPDKRRLRRGPLGRFWISLISAFPHAFTDKLRQLNIDGANRQWHIANGGDPITTPELFRVSVYRLLLRQITEYFLHDAALERWAGRFMGIDDKEVWCEAVELQIATEKLKVKLLSNASSNSSFAASTEDCFAASMEAFLEQQREYLAFWDSLETWLYQVANYQKGQSPYGLFSELRALHGENGRFTSICNQLEEQIQPFVDDAEGRLIQAAIETQQEQRTALTFEREPLFHFPEELPQVAPDLRKLAITDTKLRVLPAALVELRGLIHLDLRGNALLQAIPAQELLDGCPQLRYLNLNGTVLAERLPSNIRKSANSRPDVKKLLQAIVQADIHAPALSPSAAGAVQLFISAAPEERSKAMQARLLTHLAPLERDGQVAIWHQGKIPPGEMAKTEIFKHLNAAHIVLLLIDADFFNDRALVEDVLNPALSRQRSNTCAVIPIYLSHCDLSDHELTALTGLPDGGKDWHKNDPISGCPDPEKAWYEVAVGIRQKVESWRQQAANKLTVPIPVSSSR
jgi:hypothetical protein